MKPPSREANEINKKLEKLGALSKDMAHSYLSSTVAYWINECDRLKTVNKQLCKEVAILVKANDVMYSGSAKRVENLKRLYDEKRFAERMQEQFEIKLAKREEQFYETEARLEKEIKELERQL